MSRIAKLFALVLVVSAAAFASGCKSSKGCSSCGAAADLPVHAAGVRQA